MRKKYFYFYHLTNSPECVILQTLTPKKLSRFCLQRKRSPFQSLRRWPFLLFQKSFNYISFFQFVNRSFQKIFFIFPLDKAGKFFYNVFGLFLPGLFVTSYRWSKKADLLLKVDLFLFQNPSIISPCAIWSIPKI